MPTKQKSQRRPRQVGEAKTIKFSITIPANFPNDVRKKLEGEGAGALTFSGYIASLIERDLKNDPKNPKIIEILCEAWDKGNAKAISYAIDDADQPKVLANLMEGLTEFLLIHRAVRDQVLSANRPQLQTLEEDAPVAGALAVIPRHEVTYMRREIRRCTEMLRADLPTGFASLEMNSLESTVEHVGHLLNYVENRVWLKNSGEATDWLENHVCDESDYLEPNDEDEA